MKDKVKVAFEVPTDVPISYPIAIISGTGHADEAGVFIAYESSPDGQAILG